MRSVSKIAQWLFIFSAFLVLTMSSSAQTDNCCSVDRQCASHEDWFAGYKAYQNGQCAAPAQPKIASSSQPAPTSSSQSQPLAGVSEAIDNCCFIDWQCATDAEWTSGYWAYQLNNRCPAPSQEERQTRQPQSSSGSQDPVETNFDPRVSYIYIYLRRV